MRKPSTEHFPKIMATVCVGCTILAAPLASHGDIYRFVTIDGVETFTDAPNNRDAKLFIRNSTKKKASANNRLPAQKTHKISLNEIVENTVVSSFGNNTPVESGDSGHNLPPVGGAITSGVGMRIDPIDGKWRHHNGIDISIPEGTPVKPAAAGVVVYTGLRQGYGNTILLEHDNSMVTLYAHNSRILVATGQSVDRSTTIAYSGNTGRSTGPHLHFEAWQSGVNVTPAFMPGNSFQIPKKQMAASRTKEQFRRVLLSDGSILFTNIPASIP
jgi:murein DD-endopeptidase MepM/ murein hydrolase activator NlpD